MSELIDTLLADLRTLIGDLGKDGGLISPSVYDTAQVLRFCPPKEGVEPALEWILGQQQPDGGWGNPAVPLSRHMPTLASVLALRTYKKINPQKIESCIDAGIEFLRQHANEWLEAHIDDYPIAVEVVLPKLLEDAEVLGITLPREPYAELMKLGNKKRQQIAQMKPTAGTPPTYSWEAWGTNPTTDVVDAIGSIGTSPAATAAWIHAANGSDVLAGTRELARGYLEQASVATRVDIPGVVPTVWPINYFDLHYGLYALLVSGVLEHPTLQKAVQLQAQSLANALQPDGISYCPFFQTDPDCTAVTLIVLKSLKFKINKDVILNHFKGNSHFITFPNELNLSILANAHVIQSLFSSNQERDSLQKLLCQRQLADGRWSSDKWHASWVYITFEVIQALTYTSHSQNMELACNAILAYQNQDGGWGINKKSNSLETAWGLLALYSLKSYSFFKKDTQSALNRAHRWLLDNYENKTDYMTHWIGKELYSIYRVDRAFELSAILAQELENLP